MSNNNENNNDLTLDFGEDQSADSLFNDTFAAEDTPSVTPIEEDTSGQFTMEPIVEDYTSKPVGESMASLMPSLDTSNFDGDSTMSVSNDADNMFVTTDLIDEEVPSTPEATDDLFAAVDGQNSNMTANTVPPIEPVIASNIALDTPAEPAGTPSSSLDDLPPLDLKENATSLNASAEEPTVDEATDKKGKKAKKSKKEKKVKEPKAKKQKDPNAKPKKWPKVVAIILAVLLVIGGVGAYLVLVNPVTSNAILSTVFKPMMYWGKVEKDNLDIVKADITENFDKNFAAAKTLIGQSKASSFTIAPGEGALALAPFLGNYAAILTSTKELTFSTDSYIDGDKNSYVIDALINGTSVIQFKIMLDKKTNTLFLQIPGVCNRWFKYTLTADDLKSLETSIDLSADFTITANDVNAILDKYPILLVGLAGTTSINKKVPVDIDGSKHIVTEALATYSPEDLGKLIGATLYTAKDDDVVYGIIEQLGFFKSKDEYVKAIDKFLKDAQENPSDMELPSASMSVYIDKVGNIVGRKIVIEDKKEPITINLLNDKSDKTNKMVYSVEMGKNNVSAVVNDSISGNSHSGTIKVKGTIANETSIEVEDDVVVEDNSDGSEDIAVEDIAAETPFGFTITYDDYEVVDASKGLMLGNISFALSDMPQTIDLTATLKMTNDRVNQTNVLKIDYNKTNMITFTTTNMETAQKEVTIPEKAIKAEVAMGDKVTQYNLLLEVNPYSIILNAAKAFNNKTVTYMLAGIGKQTGLSYFNGKQTPIILMVMSKMDPTIAEIFKAGYTATKSGLNPGLDAMETATGAEEPITTPGQKEPATDAQTTP